MLRFILAALTTAMLIAAVVIVGFDRGWIEEKPTFFVPTLILVTFVTIVIYTYLYRLKNPDSFTQFYLLLMVVKVFAFLAYNIAIVLNNRADAAPNVIFFLLTYFIFTGLEIGFLYLHVSTRKD